MEMQKLRNGNAKAAEWKCKSCEIEMQKAGGPAQRSIHRLGMRGFKKKVPERGVRSGT